MIKAVINLSHITNPTNFYKVRTNTISKVLAVTEHKNIIINSGTEDALVFIVKYLNYYETDEEIQPPEHPLMENIELKDMFELEEHIFQDLLDIKHIVFLGQLIKIAEELDMPLLLKKLAAIIAYNMQIE